MARASWSRTRRIGVVIGIATLALGVGAAQAGPSVNASNYSFKPKTITIQKGQKVTWHWVNGSHTVTFVKGSFDKSLNRANPTRTRTFKRAGTYKYYCRFHRSLGMKGKVVVQ
jgi:plastocyanin